jgi:KDO2-lipid IV(A) lauroyltransferase
MPQKPLRFYQIKNWGLFFAVVLLRLLHYLPYFLKFSLFNTLGAIAAKIDSKNRRILLKNLELCFPEKSVEEREALMKACMQSHALAVMESAIAFWGTQHYLQKRVDIVGKEHLDKALLENRGIMLITGHFTTLELQGRIMSTLVDYASTAKHLKNPAADYILNQARRRYLSKTFFPEDLKKVYQALQQGAVIGFLLDQDYGTKGSVFAPFFGVPTATTTTIARIVQNTNSIAIPCFVFREKHRYCLEFYPPFENYPSDDPLKDATEFNALVERCARRYPEQYGWTYKRFSTRPEGTAPRYD